MKAPKFSSGPWSVDHEGAVLSSRPSVAICSPYPCDTDSPHGYGYGETTAANARLIAAAPELYEALQNCVYLLEVTDKKEAARDPRHPLNAARAALAKAVTL